jgi:hypothetical protein
VIPKVHCKFETMVTIKSLTPHPKNANVHGPDQIARLAEIIQYQGIRAPIVVSKRSDYIVKGHGTLCALKKLNLESVPVVYQEFDDEDQEISFLHSDNGIASWAELDFGLINSQIESFDPSFNLELLGLKDFKLDPSELPEKKKKEKKCPECGHSWV